MDHRLLPTMENEQALDFTSTPKRSSRDQLAELPVLDLSCKKQNSSSCSLSPVSIEPISNPPSIETANEDNSHDHDEHYGDTERKSPFEGRNFMVTPPSEVDSPRKPKHEGMYHKINEITSIAPSEGANPHYAMLPSNLPIPTVPAAMLSGLALPPIGVETIASLQLPVSTTTTPSNFSHEITGSMTPQESSKKAPRPFKAYPKDPLSMSVGSAELMYDQTSTEAYSEFRKRMLESVRRTNEGTNIKMRRVTKSPGLPTSTIMDEKDAAYWERRRKNNEAAKRSRDARRAKEDEIAIRAAFLEQENMKLKYELVALRNETAKLRCMIYTN
ncbi:protein giant-like [Venturia canescens]|uniref:protein giant-like n=1 Tax=Venturia canescens TaxID=32260 RepID=UPI001C9CE9DE|nr:protein giant-like [Venturia canescens]XP_043284616.1 protein giant-like [Venturia canescens]